MQMACHKGLQRNARRQPKHENEIKEEVKRIQNKEVEWEDKQRRNSFHIIEITDLESQTLGLKLN